MIALNADCFPGFTKKDLTYFKIINARNDVEDSWPNSDYFSDKPKANLKKDALYTALAVLTKSAAVLLVSRHIESIPKFWRVLAVPYIGASSVDFDVLLGNTQPFDTGIKTWIQQFETKDWLVVYKAEDVLVYFLFALSGTTECIERMSEVFDDAERLLFEGSKLTELLGYEWRKA